MKLLYISSFMFRISDGITYGLPSCSDDFFKKYLDVFSSVRVLGEPLKSYLDYKSLVSIKDKQISVRILKPNTSPRDIKNDRAVKLNLIEEISQAEAILIKPASRKGMMAIKIADKLNKPYMIEMTGDIHNALKQNPNYLKRLYAPILYRQIKKSISKCKYGLYVSKSYLQDEFPIEGKMCGCSDVFIEKTEKRVLEKRLLKIDLLTSNKRIDIALIGFYQGRMKGVDTAIQALSQLPQYFHLSVLGNGTEENRMKWISYGKRLNVIERIHFPKPLPSSQEVLLWLDTMDFFVLPTHSEGLCRCLVEAISRGCPSFATNICSMPELLSSDCLFPLGDDKKLAELLYLYSKNTKLMKELAIKNFQHAKNYNFDVLKKRRNDFLFEFQNYARGFDKKTDCYTLFSKRKTNLD